MPIRINLLAEAQAIEEARRRDPVKRSLWIAAFLVAIILIWSSSLQVKVMMARSDLRNLESGINSRTNEYQKVQADRKTLEDTKVKLASLQRLATNRFLLGNMLNALQQATVDDVQLVRLKLEQEYVLVEAAKPRTNLNRVIPGKPASTTERIALTLDARDSSASGEMNNKYQQTISTAPYFQEALGRTNEFSLKDLKPPQADPDGRQFVLFTLQCRFPEKTR